MDSDPGRLADSLLAVLDGDRYAATRLAEVSLSRPSLGAEELDRLRTELGDRTIDESQLGVWIDPIGESFSVPVCSWRRLGG